MTQRTLRLLFLPCLATSLLVLQFQCSPTQQAGNSSQAGNGMVMGMLYEPDGVTPAKSAVVHIRKKNTLADTSQPGLSKRLIDTSTVTTNDSGVFRIDTIDTGTYVIEGTSGNNLALIDSVKVKNPDSTKVVPPDTLKPAGAIKGIINLSEGGDPRQVFVLAFGIDRFARVNPDGSFKFGNLARGLYDLRLISGLSNYGVLDTSGVQVIAGDTTDLGTINLPFTGIPTPKNLKVSFDTLKQFVILTWDKADTALIDGYNIYRAIKGQNFSLITQTPLSETTTTYFDSAVAVGNTYEYRVVSRRVSGEESPKVDILGDTVIVVSSSLVTTTFTWNLNNTIGDTASINDTVRICVTYSNPTRRIEKIVWYVDSLDSTAVKQKADSLMTGKDTLVYWWKLAGNKKILVTVTDGAGTVWTDSEVVMIVQDVPVSFSGMDTTVSINDTVHLHGTATQLFGNIVEWAWDIGNTGTFNVTGNGDTTIIMPSLVNSNYLCVLRVKDDDGNVAKDTVKTSVIQDQPVANSGKDTTVSINDTVYLHGTATQQFGNIVEWAWDIGNTGTFNVTGKGDSTIIVPSLANLNYLCILRIKDDDGNVAKDTMTITVLQDVPVANAGKDVAVHSHSPFTLHGIATQQFGTIVTWEWNINGAGFITTSSGDTTITIPDLNVKSLQCTLRVTDDDGNNSSASVNLTNGLWDPIGTKGISDGFAGYLSFAIYDGTPYVTFQDSVNGRKATVMRYSGSAWEPVGKKGFSDSAADFQSLAIDNGTPYVAFRDFRNGRKTTVMRYNGSAWESVGQKGFSDSVADFHSLVIDNGTPFVAFRDVGTGSKVTVMRYNGTTWEPVGAKGFSDAGVSYLSLSIYNGTPHVAYCDLGQGYKVTVMRYNGAAWEPVGAKGFSDAGVSNLSLAIYNGTPYVAFSDLGNGIRTTVMRYNGSAWEPVGAKGFSDGNAFDQSLAIYNGTPYVAFNSGDNGKKTTVMRYNGNAWELVGTNGFSDVGSHDQTLVIYNGIPYVAFADGTSSKVSVMKFW
jgi:hypothetical protein